jgi:uncharacterized membrane protein
MRMKTAVLCIALLAGSRLALAQSVNDPLGVEVDQPPEIVEIWERYYNQETMDVEVVDGICVQTPMSLRQFFNLHHAS